MTHKAYTLLIHKKAAIPFLAIFLLFAVFFFLTRSEAFQAEMQLLSNAIAIDLALTVPVVYYFLIRKTRIPDLTVIPVFLLSVWYGSFILPPEGKTVYAIINTYKLHIAELLFISFEAVWVYRVYTHYKKIKRGYYYFYEDIKQICLRFLGNKAVANIFSSEISLLYYCFSPVKNTSHGAAFTYYKNGGLGAMTFAFSLLILVETAALHFLVQQWSIMLAWVLTCSSIYVLIYVVAQYKASKGLPITVQSGHLMIRNGLLYHMAIPLSQIKTIQITSAASALDHRQVLKIAPMGDLGGHHVIITFKEMITAPGLYGVLKTFDTLAIELDDDPETFKRAVETEMQH